MTLAAQGLVFLFLFVSSFARAQNNYLLFHEIKANSSEQDRTTTVTSVDLDLNTRPPCVLINNYCGRVVPGTGMKKECCGDLVCHRNKCRRPSCC